MRKGEWTILGWSVVIGMAYASAMVITALNVIGL